jgi:hypothetical protein
MLGIENCKELFGLVNDKEVHYLQRLQQVLVKTKRTFPSAAAVLYRVRSTTGENCSTTPSSSSRVCAQSSSNRARRHRKRSAKRRGLKANASRQAEVGSDAGPPANHARSVAYEGTGQRARDVKDAFDQADKDYRVQMAKGEITARLLSRSPGKDKMDRLKAQRTPLH